MAVQQVKISKVIGIALALLVALGVIGSMGNKRPEYSAESANTQASSTEAAASDSNAGEAAQAEAPAESAAPVEDTPKYAITEEAADTSNPYSLTITGKLTNNSGRDVSYIQVEYVLYDAEGNQIGTALANTNNLKDGGTWKFEAMSFSSPDEVASFELADVTGF